MKFELERLNQSMPDEELLADMRRVANVLGQDFVTSSQQDKFGKCHSSTIKKRFGSWSKAHEKASLKKTRIQENKRLPEDDLFRNIEEIWTKLGRQPRMSEMFPPLSRYCATIYTRRYGTWMNGLRKFVAYMNDEEKISSEEGIKTLEFEPTTRHKTQRGVNWRLRFLVMRRNNFKCINCGRSPATDPAIILHVDHIKAWANGGETVLENLQTLCSICNIGKSNLD